MDFGINPVEGLFYTANESPGSIAYHDAVTGAPIAPDPTAATYTAGAGPSAIAVY